MRFDAMVCLVALATGCGGDLPPIELDDGGEPVVEPIDAGTGRPGTWGEIGDPEAGDGPLSGAVLGVGPAEWTSPLECPLHTDDTHCDVCWSWTDGGARSLGRAFSTDHFGRAVAVADFNGDGYPDLASGAPEEWVDSQVDAGLVYIFLGSERGFQPWQVLDDSAAGGPFYDSQFGRFLHAADIDGDGASELFVGYGRWVTNTPIQGFRGGSAGLTSEWVFNLSDLDSGGSTEYSSNLGQSWASGDFDHDGDIDIAVGAPNFSGGGRVYVLGNSGGALSFDHELTGTSYFGVSLASTQDDELVVGSRSEGKVYLYDNGSLSTTYVSLTSQTSFGSAVATGDLDADGTDEILVGGFKENYVEVAQPSGAGITITSMSALAPFLVWAMDVGDLNGDGDADVILVHELDWSTGIDDTVTQFVSGDGTLNPSPTFEVTGGTNEEADDAFGRGGALADVDGNGLVDLIAGADSYSSAPSGGRVYVFAPTSGSTWASGIQPTQTIDQETPVSATCDECTVFARDDGYLCADQDGTEICVLGACVARGCGDGYREPAPGTMTWPREGCDDGNTVNGDACSDDCQEPTLLLVSSGEYEDATPRAQRPAIGEDGSGELLFVYTVEVGADAELRARRYSRGGVAREEDASPIVLASYGLGWDFEPTVAGRSDGGWQVVWTDAAADGDGSGVVTRRVLPDGSVGSLEIVSSERRGAQSQPTAFGFDGGYGVTWVDESGLESPLGTSVVHVAAFTNDGIESVADTALSPVDSRASEPDAALGPGGIFVVWTQEASDPTEGSHVHGVLLGESIGEVIEIGGPFAGQPALWATPDETGLFVMWVRRDPSEDFLGDVVASVVQVSGGTPSVIFTLPLVEQPGDPPYADLSPVMEQHPDGAAILVYEDGGRRRGVTMIDYGPSFPAIESNLLADLLTEGLQGDVSLVRTSQGLWVAWSDAGAAGDPLAYRSFVAYLLPFD